MHIPTDTTPATPFYSETAFTDAWMRGVTIAGPHYFGDGTGRGATKWDFAPDFDMVTRALRQISTGEALFLAAMYSFYNPDTGQKMLAKLGGSPGELAASLDEPRRRVIADLLVSYTGW